MSKELFDFVFGNGYRIHVTDKGFTLWSNWNRRWIIDGSILTEDYEVLLSSDNEYVGAGDKTMSYKLVKNEDRGKIKSARTVRPAMTHNG